MNSTVNSSPEDDSTNTACPSSDLTMVSPPSPNSAREADTSGQCTAESMLKKGYEEVQNIQRESNYTAHSLRE